MLEDAVLLARLGEARAVATDGAGRLYVVDAAASEVVVLDTTGAVLDRLGGTDDQAFLDVTDVDPTNGQAVYVADAGTGRIVRFTAEGRPAETIPVPLLADAQDPLRADAGLGRPVAVAAGPGNVLYAIEAERGVVLRWNADRQLDRVLGGPSSAAPLRAPSALAVASNANVLVGDGPRLQVFDGFGAYRMTYEMDAVGRISGVSRARDEVWIVGEGGVERFTPEGTLVRWGLMEGLVDAIQVGRNVYLLSRTHLVRRRGLERAR